MLVMLLFFNIQILKALKAYKPFLSCMGPLSYDLGFFPGLLDLPSMGASVMDKSYTFSGGLSFQLLLSSNLFCLWFRGLLVYSCCFIQCVYFGHQLWTLFYELIVLMSLVKCHLLVLCVVVFYSMSYNF